jgi:hypothetical protein
VRQESDPFSPRRWHHCGICGSNFHRHINVLSKVNGTSLHEIRIVQDYPDVFPEEFPGMQPNRDIEFIIELLPRTLPISNRSYRMPMNELLELKKQIV